jgi:hypothetical protein
MDSDLIVEVRTTSPLSHRGASNLLEEESMKIRWKFELCPSCKTYIVYTDGRAVCNTCKLSIDNTSEEDQLELPLDFEDDKND